MSAKTTFPLDEAQQEMLFRLESKARNDLDIAGQKVTNAFKTTSTPSMSELDAYKEETIKMNTVTEASKWVFNSNSEINIHWLLDVQSRCENRLASEWFSEFMRIVMLGAK